MRFNLFTYIFILFTWFMATDHTVAQHSSVLNRFDVDYIRGCEGLTLTIDINIVNAATLNPVFYLDGYKPGIDSASSNTTQTYNEAGSYYLVMRVDDVGIFENDQLDSILIEVFEPRVPTFTIHNCDNNLVRVEISDDYYDTYSVKYTTTDSVDAAPLSITNAYDYGTVGDYRIDVRGEFNDAPLTGLSGGCLSDNKGFTSIENIIPPTISSIRTEFNAINGSLQIAHELGDNSIYNITQSDNSSDNLVSIGNASNAETLLEGLNTKNDFYCFEIDTYDACNDLTISSDIVCSVNFQIQSTPDGHELSWNTDESIAQSYVITRNNSLLTEITDLSIKNYVDTAVICLQEYEYTVSANFTSAISSSQDTTIIAIQSGDLPAITVHPYSTVEDQGVNIIWTAPSSGEIPFRQYLIERTINSRSWSRIGTAEDTIYIDTENSFQNEQSYRISYDDDCGNQSIPSPLTTPITLQQVSSRGKIVSYSWNKYETWTEGIRNYTLERIDSEGNLIEEYPVLSGRTKDIEFGIDDLDEKLIRVRAESLDQEAQFSYSNVVDSRLSVEMFLPNAFTPDGDNLNDNFIAKGPSIDNFTMEIYNRWGILIFSTDDLINGWDGNVKGKKSPQGAYVYKIYFEDGTGREYNQTGSFLLLRKG